MNIRPTTSRRLAIAAAALACGGALLTAVPANAASASPGTVHPDACPATGPDYTFTAEGNNFHGVGPVFSDYNGSGGTATVTLTSTTSSTVTSTWSATLSVSTDALIVKASASLGYSYATAQEVSEGNAISIPVPSHKYGDGQYGDNQGIVKVEQYYTNNGCEVYGATYATGILDKTVGWNTWVSSSVA